MKRENQLEARQPIHNASQRNAEPDDALHKVLPARHSLGEHKFRQQKLEHKLKQVGCHIGTPL